MAKKSKPTKAEQRSAAARKGWATRKAEARRAAKEARQRSAAARKGWETRRAAKARESQKIPGSPRKSQRIPTTTGDGGGGGRTAPVAARREPEYAPEFEGLDDFFGGQDYDEEDEY